MLSTCPAHYIIINYACRLHCPAILGGTVATFLDQGTYIHNIIRYIIIICHGAGTTTQPIRPWAHPPRLASSKTRILRKKLTSVRKLHGLSESCLLQCEHELRSWSSLHWCDGVGTYPSTRKWWRACLPSCTRRGPRLEQAHSEECGDATAITQRSPESKGIPHTSWPITRALVNWIMCTIHPLTIDHKDEKN